MTTAVASIPGYNIIAELRGTPAARSYRARELETLDLVTLHLFERASIARADVAAAQSDLARYSNVRQPRLARLRKIRADDEFVLVETDHAGTETLATALARDGALDPARALAIAEDLLVGLVAGEMHGLHHGAIRPDCVVLDRDGHAALDGLGFAGFLPPSRDFYDVLARLVPVAADQRHAKDVYAVAALLYHMIEGHPPIVSDRAGDVKARIRRDRWMASRFADLFNAVAPLDRAEAATLLRLIRTADAEPPTAPQPMASPLLDASEPPPPPTAPPRLETARRLGRTFLAGPVWPAVAAASLGALVALLFAGPFLGGEGWHPGARSAQPLPAGTALAPVPHKRASPETPKAATIPLPAARSPFEAERERIVALADIGDFRAALESLRSAKDWSSDQLKEELGAIVAKAKDRFRELSELGRSLAADGRLADARREWETMEPFWPGEEFVQESRREQQQLVILGADLMKQKQERDRETAFRRLDAQLLDLARTLLLEEGHDYAAKLQAAEDFFVKTTKLDCLPVRDDAEALYQAMLWERDFFMLVLEHIKLRFKRVMIQAVSDRFGTGEIDELSVTAIRVRRTDTTNESIPLSRLSAAERYAFFREYRNPRTGRQALGLGLMCVRWGLKDQAQLEFAASDAAAEPTPRHVSIARRVLQEEEK